MTRPIESSEIDDLARRYVAGESLKEIASAVGINDCILRKRLLKMGIHVRSRSEAAQLRATKRTGSFCKSRITIAGIDQLIDRYQRGETEQSLASEAGVSRSAFRRRLRMAGVVPRGISDAIKNRWQSASDEWRRAIVANAHAASRGRVLRESEMISQAIGKERALPNQSPLEVKLAEMLNGLGIQTVPQRAEFIYNIDIAIEEPRIAVEVFGGNWHCAGNHARRFHERTKYLLDGGWHVVVVWCDTRRNLLRIGCAQYIAAFVKDVCGNPSLSRQYRVITGNGQLATVRKTHFNTESDIIRLGCSLDEAGQ